MHRFVFLLGLLLIATLSVHAQSQLLSLNSTDGRSIKAYAVSLAEPNVTIRMENGQVFTFPLERLDDASQATVRKDLQLQAVQRDLKVSVKVDHTREEESKQSTRTQTKHFHVVEVTLENKAMVELTDFRVEANVLILRDDMWVEDEEGLERDHLAFQGSLDRVPPRESRSVRLDEFIVREDEFTGNVSAAGTGRKSAEDNIEGRWVKVFMGGELVFEESSPRSFAEKHRWQDPADS